MARGKSKSPYGGKRSVTARQTLGGVGKPSYTSPQSALRGNQNRTVQRDPIAGDRPEFARYLKRDGKEWAITPTGGVFVRDAGGRWRPFGTRQR